jgi:hypothetical protein
MNMRGFDKEAESWDEFPARVNLAVASKCRGHFAALVLLQCYKVKT